MQNRHVGGVVVFAVAAIAVLLGSGCASADEAPAPLELTPANLAGVIDPVMTAWVDDRKGPGAVVVVVTPDGPVFARGYGVADRQAGQPFSADATLVRPGSISKLFTGIAVMQLVDAGTLDLDRDVNDYLDFAVDVPDGGVAVTLRRLLTHRAGFEEHVKGVFSRNPEPEPLGRWLAANQPRRIFPRGDVEAYSNYGVALAGYVVERVSGEPFAGYVQRHILAPLGMSRSTFLQPLPDHLAPLMAKRYRRSDEPPRGPFETIVSSPAGALSSTGADMGRFMRAVMNGGTLDGVRILPQARLEQMTTPDQPSPAGAVGLVFFTQTVDGHRVIGHEGATTSFFSDLKIFPADGIGVFVSRDGPGEIASRRDIEEMPDPATLIARRFLRRTAIAAADGGAPFAASASVAGAYHPSRRSQSSFASVQELAVQRVVKMDGDGNARAVPAVWPFAEGVVFRHIDANLYEGPAGIRLMFVDDGPGSYLAGIGGRFQRVPWWLDLRWITPALAASLIVAVVTLVAWPIAALWRRRHGKRERGNAAALRGGLAARLVLGVDVAVIVAFTIVVTTGVRDLAVFSDALDPVLVVLQALAWLGVFGAVPAVLAAAAAWRGAGTRWSRIHNTLMAAASVMLAWFFVTFHLAGTTLNY